MKLDIKKEVVEKLKKHHFDKDNGIGVMLLLEKSDDVIDNYKKMSKYLDDETKTRNDIFEYAFSLSNVQQNEYEIE